MLWLKKWTLASAMTKLAPPGCMLLKPLLAHQSVGSPSSLTKVLIGIVVGLTLKLPAKVEMKMHCPGKVSPFMIVFERPSRTSSKRTALL